MYTFFSRIEKSDWWKEGYLQFFLLSAIIILLPIYHWFVPPFMIVWGILFIIEIRYKVIELASIPFPHRLLFLLFIFFFLWQLFGLLYSEHLKEGIRNLTLRIPILLFPLYLIIPGLSIKKRILLLLRLFALSTLAFILFCLGFALYRSVTISNGSWIFNHHLPDYPWLSYFYGSDFSAFHHPSYISMFVLLSIFIAIESFLNNSVRNFYRWGWLFTSIILMAGLYLLSSRAALITAAISIPVYFLHRISNTKYKNLTWIILPFILVFLVVTLFSNPRLKMLTDGVKMHELLEKSRQESRMGLWKTGFILIKEHPILGVGTGDIQSMLNAEYNKSGQKDLLLVKDLNTHNQLIEITAEHGLIGLGIFLSVLIVMFIISLNTRNILYLVFLIIVFVSFMFETMLNRLAGLVFFCLFSFLFLNLSDNDNRNQLLVK